eukprot:2395169-Amphidinium_carterae.1
MNTQYDYASVVTKGRTDTACTTARRLQLLPLPVPAAQKAVAVAINNQFAFGIAAKPMTKNQ